MPSRSPRRARARPELSRGRLSLKGVSRKLVYVRESATFKTVRGLWRSANAVLRVRVPHPSVAASGTSPVRANSRATRKRDPWADAALMSNSVATAGLGGKRNSQALGLASLSRDGTLGAKRKLVGRWKGGAHVYWGRPWRHPTTDLSPVASRRHLMKSTPSST